MERYRVKKKVRWSYVVAIIIILFLATTRWIAAEANEGTASKRQQVYEDFDYASGVAWYEIAAIDQYERNIAKFIEGPASELSYETISIR